MPNIKYDFYQENMEWPSSLNLNILSSLIEKKLEIPEFIDLPLLRYF